MPMIFKHFKIKTLNQRLITLQILEIDGCLLLHSHLRRSIYGLKANDPKKMLTPYGGRLVWTMPGGNKLIAHLKDNTLVRNKKRWSQVKDL